MALGNEVAVKNDPKEEPNKEPEELEASLTQTEQSQTTSNSEIIDTPTEVKEENVEEVVEVESNEATEDPPAEAEEEVEESVPAEEEEEDEEDLIDPMDTIRDQCKVGADAVKYAQILEDCNNRVNSRSHTDEKCHEEMIDYMHAVDQCMSKKVFSQLK